MNLSGISIDLIIAEASDKHFFIDLIIFIYVDSSRPTNFVLECYLAKGGRTVGKAVPL